MMAMATLMARGTMSTVNPAATSWEEMWRDVSPISSLSFSSLKSSVSNVSVSAISSILILCCLRGWQNWTQAAIVLYFDLAISPYIRHCRQVKWGPGHLTLVSSRFLPQWIPQITPEPKWTRTEIRDFTACKAKRRIISSGNIINLKSFRQLNSIHHH